MAALTTYDIAERGRYVGRSKVVPLSKIYEYDGEFYLLSPQLADAVFDMPRERFEQEFGELGFTKR